jgi:hypothetical protein
MDLFERVHITSFAGATGWLNSEPLGPAELRGQVVLANFWTSRHHTTVPHEKDATWQS